MTMTTAEFHRGHDDPRARGPLPHHFRTTFTNTKNTTSPCPKNKTH